MSTYPDWDLTESNRLNAKLALLTNGTDINIEAMQELEEKHLEDLQEAHKINRIKVSDRHFIDPESVARDYIPDELIIEDSTGKSISKLYYKEESPLEITTQNDEIVLRDKEIDRTLNADISPAPVQPYSLATTEDGHEIEEFVPVVGIDRISVLPYDGCEEFRDGKGCKFCGANPQRLGLDEGPLPNVLEIKNDYDGDAEEWWGDYREDVISGVREGLKEMKKDDIGPHKHFIVTSGNLWDKETEWDLTLDVLQSTTDIISYDDIDSYFNLVPPEDRSQIQVANDLGFQNIQFNLEVFDRETFEDVCPGKNERYGYENMREALRYAVDVFGEGNVRSNFVLGAEPIEDFIRGAEELGEEGVVADYSVFFPRPASKWSERDPLEPQEVLEAAYAIDDIYQEHGFEPIYCAQSSRSSIANEVRELR